MNKPTDKENRSGQLPGEKGTNAKSDRTATQNPAEEHSPETVAVPGPGPNDAGEGSATREHLREHKLDR